MIDIYIDELEEACPKPDANVPFETILAPLRTLGEESPTKPIRQRIKEALEDSRVKHWLGQDSAEHDGKTNEPGHDENEDEEWAGIEDE